MWVGIAKWFASFLTGPIFDDLLKGYQAKLAAGTSSEQIAGDLAAKELAAEQAQDALQSQLKVAEIGHWYEPEKLFAYVVLIYFAKVILWDKVLGLGVTDPITGDAAKWASMIMTFYVGKRTFENVARIIKR